MNLKGASAQPADADNLRAVVRRRCVAVGSDNHHIIPELHEVFNETEEAIFHSTHMAEG